MAKNQNVNSKTLYQTITKADYLARIWRATFQGFHSDTMENRTALVLIGDCGDIPYLRDIGIRDCNIYGVERVAKDCAKARRKYPEINVLHMELDDAINWLVERGIKIDIVSLDFCAFIHPGMLRLIQKLLRSGILSRRGRLAITFMHARDYWFMRLTESLWPRKARKAKAPQAKDNPYRKLCRWLDFSKPARRNVLWRCLEDMCRGKIGFEMIGEDSYTNRWHNEFGVECYTPMSWIVVKAIRGHAVTKHPLTRWESFA